MNRRLWAVMLVVFFLPFSTRAAPTENGDIVATGEEIDIRDYGAKPDDGLDDTDAIGKADQAASANGKGVLIPPGQFIVAGSLTLCSSVRATPGGRLKKSGEGSLTFTTGSHFQALSQHVFIDWTSGLTFADGTIERLNASWFGLVGDGNIANGTGTDNGMAFKQAIAAYKATASAVYNGKLRGDARHFVSLYIPAGIFLTKSSLFLGSDRVGNDKYGDKVQWVYAEPGTIILGKLNGPVLDLSGGHKIKIENLTIVGDDEIMPTVGLLLSRSGSAEGKDYSAAGHRFYNVDILGHYSVSGVYNYASEINIWFGCFISSSAGHAAYIQTLNNARYKVSSPNTLLPTPKRRSTFGDRFFGCNFDYRAKPSAKDGCAVRLESVVRGPQFYGCYFNQGADDVPYIRITQAKGAANISQQTLIDGCVFHAKCDSVVQIEGHIANFRMSGCSFSGKEKKGTVVLDDADIGGSGIIMDNAYIEAPTIDAKTYMTGKAKWQNGTSVRVEYQSNLNSFFKTNADFNGDIWIDSKNIFEVDGNISGAVHYTDTGEIRTRRIATRINSSTVEYSATGYEGTIFAETGASPLTINLPDISGAAGTAMVETDKTLTIVFENDGGANLIIAAFGDNQIDAPGDTGNKKIVAISDSQNNFETIILKPTRQSRWTVLSNIGWTYN